MNTSRRNFIKIASAGTLGITLLPAFARAENVWSMRGAAVLSRTSPEAQGISSSAIRKFISAANESGLQWHGFMLLRHGNVVAEGWWKPFDPGYKHTLYSLSKSFTSTAVGLLVKDGKLSVDDTVIS